MIKDRTEKARVFVYGTLLAGEANDYHLEDSELLGLAELSGKFKMLDLGAYPAVVEDDDYLGEIVGEVYEVTLGTLSDFLDRLEGVDVTDPEDKSGRGKGLYYRREVNVAVEGDDGAEIVEAWVYLMNPKRAHGEIIASGSWRERVTA